MTGSLVLSDAEPRAKEIREHAERADNWYRYGASTWIAADRPEHVLKSGTVKAVFTWTMDPDGKVFRHLSISSNRAKGKLPPPIFVWTLCRYFGFTGSELGEGDVVHKPAESWKWQHVERDGCIVVIEEVKCS